MFFESAAGIELDIQAGVSATLPIAEFYIEPGTYPYLYVQLSSKLGMQWSGRMSNDVTGASAEGTYCWTSNAGMKASSYPDGDAAFTTAHGTSMARSVITMDCGTSEGTVVTTYELLTKFGEENCSALGANGDKLTFEEKEGTGASRGLPTVILLASADVFATTCANASIIAWTTDLDTAYTITEDSTFAMSVKATAANSLEFSNGNNNDIEIIASGAPRIYLTVTD